MWTDFQSQLETSPQRKAGFLQLPAVGSITLDELEIRDDTQSHGIS